MHAIFQRPVYPTDPKPQPMPPDPAPVIIPPTPIVSTYLWSTQEQTRHSIRVLCDEEGLSYSDKNDVTACIYQESEFKNWKDDGTPMTHTNPHSTDWGLCQINDTHGWYIGPPPLPFASVDYLVAHPEAAVRFMIEMCKQKRLGKWVSYSSGAYKQWLPHVMYPVPTSGHYPPN